MPIGIEESDGPKGASWAPGDKHPLYVDLVVPCRQCPPCLKARSRRWREAVRKETQLAPRSWFVTLTIAPEHRFRIGLEAGVQLLQEGQYAPDQFAALHKVAGKEVTKFLKRVRKGDENHPGPHKLRYCLVVEAHTLKHGFPHYHAVVHEVAAPITKRLIQGAWHYGHSSAKLVDSADRAAWYVAKYLHKSALARVRASKDYW